MKIICQCCFREKEAKTNTHYLMDALIRQALNQEGSSKREKGLSFEINKRNPFIDFGFQRSTNPELVEKALGRIPTDEEIDYAKSNIPFSVSDKFCKECEDKFSEIENDFFETIEKDFRSKDFEKLNINEIFVKENLKLRKFFLLQYWRTMICEPRFNGSKLFKKKIQNGLFKNPKILKYIPLKITYLNTTGSQEEYTKNIVGFFKFKGYSVIFLNDFLIQAFENKQSIRFNSLSGLNNINTYAKSFNFKENEFKVEVLNNKQRLFFLKQIVADSVGKENRDEYFQNIFIEQFKIFVKKEPSFEIINSFMNEFAFGEDTSEELRFSHERYVSLVFKYLTSYESIS